MTLLAHERPRAQVKTKKRKWKSLQGFHLPELFFRALVGLSRHKKDTSRTGTWSSGSGSSSDGGGSRPTDLPPISPSHTRGKKERDPVEGKMKEDAKDCKRMTEKGKGARNKLDDHFDSCKDPKEEAVELPASQVEESPRAPKEKRVDSNQTSGETRDGEERRNKGKEVKCVRFQTDAGEAEEHPVESSCKKQQESEKRKTDKKATRKGDVKTEKRHKDKKEKCEDTSENDHTGSFETLKRKKNRNKGTKPIEDVNISRD